MTESALSLLDAVSTLLGLTLGGVILFSLVSSLVFLVGWLQDHQNKAHGFMKRLALILLFINILLITSESLPLPYLLFTSLLHLPWIFHKTYTSRSTSSLFNFLFLLILPFLAHITLARHVANLHTTLHEARTAPLLPGGRLNWDLPDPSSPEAKESRSEEYTAWQIATLFLIGIWIQTISGWILLLARWSHGLEWELPSSTARAKEQQGVKDR